MRKILICLLLACICFAQEEDKVWTSVGILPSSGIGLNDDEFGRLTDEIRKAALQVLLDDSSFVVLTNDVIVTRLGGAKNYLKECRETSCIVDLGKKASVDYVAQATVNSVGLKIELYNVNTKGQVNLFTDDAKDYKSLIDVVKKSGPGFFSKIPGAVKKSKFSVPVIEPGIAGVQTAGGGYEFEGGKSYLVNLSTEPSGAIMSFDGVPAASCPKTPCKATIGEGSVRIIAALEQYETADTTVSIKQNNMNINIRLKANFGVLEIKPAYLDGIGTNRQWNLTINDKPYSFGEIRFSPSKYSVKLSHECYENISFEAGINKDRREVFDMSKYIALKKGGLVLKAERDGEPVSEPVFVNGVQAGETPFSGAVPLCAKIEIGRSKELVDVRLRHNDNVTHTMKIGGYLTDSRDGKRYKIVVIGNQTWMAENLNYNASGSKCYNNDERYCNYYGRLYNWNAAKSACPKGWHLPSDAEWTKLTDFVGGEKTAGTRLKSASGWSNNGNGTDEFGFSALPGGNGYSDGSFNSVGKGGYWWSATESYASNAWYRYMLYDLAYVFRYFSDKSYYSSVRCVQDQARCVSGANTMCRR